MFSLPSKDKFAPDCYYGNENGGEILVGPEKKAKREPGNKSTFRVKFRKSPNASKKKLGYKSRDGKD
jgi:hypothetical protein